MTNLNIEEKRSYRIAKIAHSLSLNCFISDVNNLIQESKFIEAKSKLELIKQEALLGYLPNDYYYSMFKVWDYDSIERSQFNEDGMKIIKEAYRKAYNYIEESEDEFIAKQSKAYKAFTNNEKYNKFLENKEFDNAREVLTRRLGDYFLNEDEKDLSREEIILNKRIIRKAYLVEMDRIAIEEAKVIVSLKKGFMELIKNNSLYKDYKEALDAEEYEEAEEYFFDIVNEMKNNQKNLSENEKRAFEDLVKNIYKNIDENM